jgi:hypothetical protein
MTRTPVAVLDVLDRGADDFNFPMLDNGYIYLAAIRLSLHRSNTDWALVFERFGYSPRAGIPSLDVHTFASRRRDGDGHFSFASVYPVDPGDWIDHDDRETVASAARTVTLRGRSWPLPARDAYATHGIELPADGPIRVFELSRYLAAVARDDVLATVAERRADVPGELTELMVLDDWHHPDVRCGQRPSASTTFQQLAAVLHSGELGLYRPTASPNTHWRHWPEGGTL